MNKNHLVIIINIYIFKIVDFFFLWTKKYKIDWDNKHIMILNCQIIS